jgi:CHAT domain-containing protein
VLRYPFDPPESFHPLDHPESLLLTAYERWFLEDLTARNEVFFTVHCDAAATREAFLAEDIGECTILHLSTHGEAFAETWEVSNLMFASQGMLPARVHAFDLLGRDWSRLELVFLNSCLSSAGKHTSGEQPLSLAWAFLAGGAKSVIASRWWIEDRVALQFMRMFYDHLLSSSSFNVALAFQFARHRLRDDPRFNRPSQWMSFVLMNNLTTMVQ